MVTSDLLLLSSPPFLLLWPPNLPTTAPNHQSNNNPHSCTSGYIMGIKAFMVPFILTSTIFSILFLPPYFASFAPATGAASRPSYRYPASFAYLISASRGDVGKLERVVRALYHPANHYLLHLDLEASADERRRLSEFVSGEPAFAEAGNVWIVRKSNLVTYRGPSMLASTLHAISMLLRTCEWDWFINLSASDYPLVTQDDLIHAFSKLPRDLNFIGHTGQLGWKLKKRAKPIIIDPGLYSMEKSEIVWADEQRALPTAFKLYTGSAWMVLSISFTEYIIVGWHNLPRTLLLYYTNFISSPEGYFHTLICNSMDYRNTTVNHDLHYITWDFPPKQHPKTLGMKDFKRLIISGFAFARKFKENDPVLDRIDRDLLCRYDGKFSHGGWCSQSGGRNETCSGFRDGLSWNMLRPGAGSRRLKAFINKLLSSQNFRRKQCR